LSTTGEVSALLAALVVAVATALRGEDSDPAGSVEKATKDKNQGRRGRHHSAVEETRMTATATRTWRKATAARKKKGGSGAAELSLVQFLV